MKPALIVIGVLICVAFVASIWIFAREKNGPSFIQVLGEGFLLVVVFTHVFEALHLFPSMGWGLPRSVGHYIDLVSAICGLIFVAVGYFFRRLGRHRNSNGRAQARYLFRTLAKGQNFKLAPTHEAAGLTNQYHGFRI